MQPIQLAIIILIIKLGSSEEQKYQETIYDYYEILKMRI